MLQIITRHTSPVALCALTFAGFLLAGLPGEASGAGSRSDEVLQRCRVLHGQIDRYTRMRRAGGNSLQMERWRKARQKYEVEYRERRCYRFGRRLRGDR